MLDAEWHRVLEQRLDVPVVGAHGMAGEGALGGKMAAEFRQRRAEPGGQAGGQLSASLVAQWGKVCTGPGRLGTTSAVLLMRGARTRLAAMAPTSAASMSSRVRWMNCIAAESVTLLTRVLSIMSPVSVLIVHRIGILGEVAARIRLVIRKLRLARRWPPGRRPR